MVSFVCHTNHQEKPNSIRGLCRALLTVNISELREVGNVSVCLRNRHFLGLINITCHKGTSPNSIHWLNTVIGRQYIYYASTIYIYIIPILNVERIYSFYILLARLNYLLIKIFRCYYLSNSKTSTRWPMFFRSNDFLSLKL